MSYTIPSGSIIVFKNTITYSDSIKGQSNSININATYNPVDGRSSLDSIYINPTGTMLYYVSTGYGRAVYDYTNNSWNNANYQTITLTQDYTTDNENIIEWLKTNVSSGLPAEPMEEAYQATGNLISNTFSSIGQITEFVSNNNAVWICTAGIIIVSFVVGLLRRIRKRTFKSR